MKRARRILLALALLLMVAAIAGWLYLRSETFRESLRQRIVAEVERASGGKASLGGFEFDWARNRITVRDFVLRGKEPAEAAPLVKLEQGVVSLSVTSYLQMSARLRAVRLDGLAVNLITMPDGTTNLPGPKVRSDRNPVEEFLKVAIGRFEVHRGTLRWNFEKYPLEVRGDELEVDLRYQAKPVMAYAGPVKAKRVSLEGFGLRDARFDVDGAVALEKERLRFDQVRVTKGKTVVEGRGALEGWKKISVAAEFALKGEAADMVPMLGLPVPPRGRWQAKGRVEFREDWLIDAEAEGQEWSLAGGGVEWNRIAWSGHVAYAKREAKVSRLRVDLPVGVFRGSADTDFRKYAVQGTVGGLQLTELQRYFSGTNVPWQGFVSGPVRIEGEGRNAEVHAHLTVSPNDSERAIEGQVEARYSTGTGALRVDRAQLSTAVSQIEASGSLDERLSVKLSTSDLRDIPYADRVPLRLDEDQGRLRFDGAVTGGWAKPVVEGLLQIERATYEGERIDQGSAQIRASRGGIDWERLSARQGEMEIGGSGSLAWFDAQIRDWSAVRAQVQVRGAEVARVLKALKLEEDAAGTAAGELEITGTVGDPKASGPVRIANARYGKDALGTVSGVIRYAGDRVEVERGQLTLDQRPVFFAGSFVPESRNAKQGDFRLDVRTSGLAVERVAWFRERQPDFAARADVDVKSAGRLRGANGVQLTSLAGFVNLPQVAYRGRSLGSLNLRATTEAELLRVTATGNLRGASINSASSWKLTDPKLAGSGDFQVVNLKLGDFEDFLGSPESKESAEPAIFAEGSVRARGTFNGALREIEKIRGSMRLENLEIAPRQLTGTVKRDLTLRSPGPVDVDFDERGLTIKNARLEAKDTSLTASGLVALSRTGASNLRLQGNVNLGVLSALKPDLIATGDSTVDANFRGSFGQPQVTGRMEFRNASFFLRNVPNGLEQVNGVVFFDRTRARIESFSAQSGGGTLRLGGFVGFGNELTYQLQASGQNVRVRYPEGISTSVNAALTLTGGSSRSLLSGGVTILRMAVAPRADIGTMIAESAKATTAGPPRFENEFLKEMQIDVRVDTALDAELTSSLTQNVQAEVNLRLRGTPARPIVLGRVSFTQGDLNFFGAKYNIDRGEINFYNQTKIEPVINLDLQTRIRGVLVTITFAGPANKLNLSYRSDPPLQSSEILALLTVGRAPDNPTIGGGSTVQSPTFLQGASSALLGQAATAPITGRLQRLFGVSRVRIDPQLTGIENTAQARLTIEQQVSRDITVTFITNLNRTQQQIVSVEWDFSRDFSAVAIRDENGIFGLDFFYRKRFK